MFLKACLNRKAFFALSFLFVLNAVASLTDGRCIRSLRHPAAQIYLSNEGRFFDLPRAEKPKVYLRRGPLDLLLTSPRKSTYQAILDRVQNPELHKRVIFVLTELERLHEQREISNYEMWIEFLARSPEENIAHSIFEGLHAVYLLKSLDVAVSFEGRNGFFYDYEAEQPRKSLDLQVRDFQSDHILAYKEVKRVWSLKNISGALNSAIKKAEAVRPLVGSDVELSAVIYFEAPELVSNRDRKWELRTFRQKAQAIQTRLTELNHKLDSLLVVDLRLAFCVEFYVQPDGSVVMKEAQYPLFRDY